MTTMYTNRSIFVGDIAGRFCEHFFSLKKTPISAAEGYL